MMYQPTKESLAEHQPPIWYQDAKLGIFIHWGLYSTPAWAVKTVDFHHALREKGSKYWFVNNAYAEWYWNSLKLDGSPTQVYHREKYGEKFAYENFAQSFEQATKLFDAKNWAHVFKQAEARYAVMTSKHHEGYLLWDSRYPNPKRPDFHTRVDLVGEFCAAMRSVGIRPGLYYSGGLDWLFDPRPIETMVDVMAFCPTSKEYAAYVDQHFRELIDRYKPDILWNDICYPHQGDLYSLLADYYNCFPDGVVNDRFTQMNMGFVARSPFWRRLIDKFIQSLLKRGVDILNINSPARIGDFRTPEYTHLSDQTTHKWETCRGLGKSFGFNRDEGEEDLISVDELVHMFVDIVSKNGNLLLNVGPRADGSIPELQRQRLHGLGDWLAINGEAIFGSRPWKQAQSKTTGGIPLRFTQKGEYVYCFVLSPLRTNNIQFPYSYPVKSVSLLGREISMPFSLTGSLLEVELPPDITAGPGYTLKLM